MGLSELKLLLFREIDALPTEKLAKVQAFLASMQETTPKERKAGTLKGLVSYMASDFDAPMEDFKEYMP